MAKHTKPVLEHTTQAFIDALEAQGGKPLYTLSYEDARKVLEDAQAINVKKLPADIEEKVFPGGPTGELRSHLSPYGHQRTSAGCDVLSRRRMGPWQQEHARQIGPRPGER